MSMRNFYWAVAAFLTVLAAVSPFMDIAVSRIFYVNGSFLLHSGFLNNVISFYIPVILVGIAAGIFIVWLWDVVCCRKEKVSVTTRVMLLTTGSMILGPGLIVNGLLKSFWGRARPSDVDIFDGDKSFSAPWVISDQCSWDCSFVSGHTAAAFWTVSLALLAPEKYRAAAVFSALCFGCFVGLGRIVQGAHFFSDVYFSALIMIILISVLHVYLKKHKI